MLNLDIEFLNSLEEFQNDKKEHIRFAIVEEDAVTYGFEKDCNVNYCQDHNILCYDRKGPGGTIVHAKGSLAFNYIYSHDRFPGFISCEFLKDFAEYLTLRNLNVEINKNDLLVDGCKVASTAEVNLPPDFRWCDVVILISTTCNIDLIRKVCLKPMDKIPAALNDYGITTDEVIKFMIDWFKRKGVDIGYPT